MRMVCLILNANKSAVEVGGVMHQNLGTYLVIYPRTFLIWPRARRSFILQSFYYPHINHIKHYKQLRKIASVTNLEK